MEVDICIIGAGIVGLATAYQLSLHSKYKIVVIEKESTFAAHQTGHNSGVIHSGIYYTPGSLRAINCKRGYDLLLDFCNKHDVEYDVCGKVIVATRVEDTPALDKIMRHGEANGLVGIKRIGREETLEHEPYVNAVESIWVPQSGIIDYKKVCQKYADLLEDNGQIILYDNELVEIREEHDYIWAIGKRQEIKSRLLINCAGLYSDKVSKMTMPE
ncbi:MAG: FAD-dependent oxidoreductase, partial [Bacteroidota bacterium]